MEKDESKIAHFHPTHVKTLRGRNAYRSGVSMKETYSELYVTDVECACRTINSVRIGPGGAVPPDPDDGRRYPPYFKGTCTCGRLLWLMIFKIGSFDPETIIGPDTRKAQCHCGTMNDLHHILPELDTRQDNPYRVVAYKNKCSECGRILYYHIMESKGKKMIRGMGDYEGKI